jgi:predicted phage terminase large subunit-like protein
MGIDPSEFRRAQRELLRAHIRDKFYAFYKYIAAVIMPGQTFLLARHFLVLARALEKVATGEIKRLLIAIPPRHGKSMLASVAFPAWMLGRHPNHKIICATYGDVLTKDFSTRFRDIMLSPAYQGLFPEAEVDAGGGSLVELRTIAKGYRLATTVSGAVTGKGAHLIIVDDPLKAIDARSESERNKVYDWLKGSLMSRFDNPAEGAMIVIHQRLHQDDPIGRLIADGGWTYLEMPGECVERQTFDLGDGETWQFNPGDLLFPERFGREALDQQLIDFGEMDYNAQILQRPSPPGGNLFKMKHFQRYEKLPQLYETIVQSWDPAMVDTETAAFTVCTTWGIQGRKLYLIDVLRKRLEFHQIEPAIISMRAKFNAKAVILEVAGVGKAIGNSLLRREGTSQWAFFADPKLGKVERAIAQTPKIERKRVYLPNSAAWLEAFELEVASFPLSKYADQVDSMVHFLNWLNWPSRHTLDLTAVRDYREQPF